MNCPNCENCELTSICDKCDGKNTFSYKKHKEDPIIVSCQKHRNPNFPEDEFIEVMTKHWYERGKIDGNYETLAQVNKDLERIQKKKSWW